jgi:hypothetical protein
VKTVIFVTCRTSSLRVKLELFEYLFECFTVDDDGGDIIVIIISSINVTLVLSFYCNIEQN